MSFANYKLGVVVATAVGLFSFFSYILYQIYPGVKLLLFVLTFTLGVLYISKGLANKYLLTSIASICILVLIGAIIGYGQVSSNLSSVSFYVPIVLGVFICRSFDSFFNVAKVFFIINLIAMLYEFYTFSFLFEPEVDLPHFVGRAKGLLAYSKEAANFVILFSIVFVKKLGMKWYLPIIAFAFLTGSRLAILICCAVIMFEIVYPMLFGVEKKTVVRNLSVFLLFVILIIYYLSLEQSSLIVSRLYESFNTEHSSNSERIYFWVEHLNVYDQFAILQLIFGYPGASVKFVGNGAESAWINLIVDGGMVAFSVYSFSMLMIFFMVTNKVRVLFMLLLLSTAMQIARVNLGFVDSTIYWGWFWSLLITSLAKVRNVEK